MKQTKAGRFRELYSVIEELLKTYTYEGVLDVLKNQHDLDIRYTTFRTYLMREREKAKTKQSMQYEASKNKDRPTPSNRQTSLPVEEDVGIDEETGQVNFDDVLADFKNEANKPKSIFKK